MGPVEMKKYGRARIQRILSGRFCKTELSYRLSTSFNLLRNKPCKEDRNKERRDKRSSQHTAQHACTHGLTSCRTGTGCRRQRNDAQDEGHGGHHNRTQAEFRSFQRCLSCFKSLFHLLGRKLHNQNGVLRRQTNQHQQTDLEVNIV